MPLLLRNIRSGKRRALLTELESITKKELEKNLDSKIKPLLVKSHEIIVANWEHKPVFKTRKEISADKISMTVFPTGENAKIFKWVDKGTKDHMIPKTGGRIYPVRAKALSFNYGGKYVSKTLAKPARTFSGGGVVVGGVPTVVASVAAHMVSGIEPREFTQTIADDIQPDFIRVIENTFRDISRRLEE